MIAIAQPLHEVICIIFGRRSRPFCASIASVAIVTHETIRLRFHLRPTQANQIEATAGARRNTFHAANQPTAQLGAIAKNAKFPHGHWFNFLIFPFRQHVRLIWKKGDKWKLHSKLEIARKKLVSRSCGGTKFTIALKIESIGKFTALISESWWSPKSLHESSLKIFREM